MSEISQHEVIIARSAEDREKCLDIRFEVFHKEQRFSADDEIDEYDKRDNASHLLLRLTPSLTPVGTIRCIKLAPFTYKLTRLAVLKTYRNQNLGRSLILAFHNHVKAQARMELIDNTTSTDNTTPSNFANNSVQSSTKPIPNSKACADSLLARTMTITSDDHPDQDPISGSISMPSNVPVSSAKIIAHSQIPVQDFYARFGYQPEGEPFDEDGEPHQKMVLQLPLPN